jgi:hypothetical protein
MSSSFIFLSGKYIPTAKLRADTKHIDQDIKNDPEVLLERYIYEERLQLEEKGETFLILSTKTAIIE